MAHLLSEQQQAGENAAAHPFGLDAYRLQIGSRISYSGLVRPIDLRI